jgi:hypothetical protein
MYFSLNIVKEKNWADRVFRIEKFLNSHKMLVEKF